MRLSKQFTQWLLLLSLSIGGLATAYAEEHAEQQPTPFVWAPNVTVGDTFPEFTLSDQDGNVQTNSTIAGKAGYLIQFHRSVVW